MKTLKWILAGLLLLVLLIMTFTLKWGVANFGNIGVNEIIFTLSMPLQGVDQSFFKSYTQKALLPALGIFVGVLVVVIIARALLRKTARDAGRYVGLRRFTVILSAVLVVAWLGILINQANASFGLFDYIDSITHQSRLIEEEYVDPNNVTLTFPEQKRNLIYIFVESAETTNQDVENGGTMPANYISEMTALAKQNVSFSQSELIEGASVAPLCGWTIAGIVAETAGVPLKLYKLDDSTGGVDNSMDQYASFLPGCVTIGDILEKEGYHNVFMAGSDFVFGGRELYCTSHGNYEILDYKAALERNVVPPDYHVNWGIEDKVLYDWAKKELLALAEEGKPFNLTLLTVDTHHPDGFLCDLCVYVFAEKYAIVWACASRQLGAFISWIQEQDFYENTTIVIAGDHCSMAPGFYKELEYHKYAGETARKVYNVFINSATEPVKEKNRLFTTLDLYPSTLAAMGVKIEGEHLGLGVNLFSDEQTLSEKYGYETFFSELSKKSLFYDQKLLYP